MLSLQARRTLRAIRESLPPNEWHAVSLWLQSFYRYQLEILLDWSRFALNNKSRQIGFSHTLSAQVVLWSMFGEDNSIVSIGQREADEVLAKSEMHAETLMALGSEWARCKPNGDCLHFAGGGKIQAFPNSSAARSFSGNVILDEIGYFPHDPQKTWDAAAGSTLHNYRLRANSTPNGVGNFWYNLWSDPTQHQGYTLHQYTIDDAIADGLNIDINECWKMARHDKRVFDQMFRCSFLDNDQQYLPTDLLEACRWPKLEPDGSRSKLERFIGVPKGGRHYAGLDIGKSVDLSALVIVRVVEGMRWVVHVETRSRTNTQDLYDLAALAFGPLYRCEMLCVDSTGLGSFPAENLVKRYGLRHVEPVEFTLNSKEDLATGLFEFMQDDRARIPRAHHDAKMTQELIQLMTDLASIRRIVTEKGNVTYDAPHTAQGHADRAWAFALAMRAARRQSARGVVK